jgi:isopenicillin-N N-acyltransferase-like protein
MHCWALLASGLLLCTCADAAACNGHSTPGPQNLNPIDTAAPIFVRSVLNGKLYSVGTGDDTKDLLHVWGTPHENGLAMGQLLGPKLPAFIREVYTYTESQIIAQAANNTSLQKILKMGLTVALDLSYARTKDYIKPYVMQELQGLADSTNGAVSVTDIRNVMWLGEITRGSCSMYGAWGDAVASDREGKLLQLRALDWDTEGPFKNYASIVVYHPNPGQGHAWANVGFGGWTGSITGKTEHYNYTATYQLSGVPGRLFLLPTRPVRNRRLVPRRKLRARDVPGEGPLPSPPRSLGSAGVSPWISPGKARRATLSAT